MKYRCLTPTAKSYAGYGGRGIRVCDRWRESFADFLADVGHRPTPKHSLGRIDNDGHYEPGNVRWETRKEQMRNRTCTQRVTWNDETKPITEWAERVGLSPDVLYARIKMNWPIHRAMTHPPRKSPRPHVRSR